MLPALRSVGIALVAAAAIACAPRARPDDMSAAAHELTAAHEQRAAYEHAQEYEPGATGPYRCPPGAPIDDPCWESLRNPIEVHRRKAAAHQRRAAEHRAASRALREAEARACAGVPEADRDEGPFEHEEYIESVAPLRVPAGAPYGGGGPFAGHVPDVQRLEGAVVTFRAVEGMTTAWLQRVIDCHLARNAALGHQVPEMPDSPLVPKGVTATVSPSPTGFTVTIRTRDPAAAEDVWRRAQSLVAR